MRTLTSLISHPKSAAGALNRLARPRARRCTLVALALLLAAFAGAELAWCPPLPGGTIVYDNTLTPEDSFLGATSPYGPTEFGDEIALAGTARIVTEFQFEYYADFTPTGRETARIRFYRNDGKTRLYRFLFPSTLLWDSGTFPIYTNYNSKTLIVPYVGVPSDFTWTVEFGGVSQDPGDQAGLLFYNPPTIGGLLNEGRFGSYDDYWKRVGIFWALFNFGGHPVANFGCRVTAIDERVDLTSSVDPATGLVQLTWSGEQPEAYLVQSSTDLQQWNTLGSARMQGSGPTVSFVDRTSATNGRTFYRVVRLATILDTPTVTSPPRPQDGALQVQWVGNPNALYSIQTAARLNVWTNYTVARADASGYFQAALPVGSQGTQFYRAVHVQGGTEQPALTATADPQTRAVHLKWQGTPGTRYPIEMSPDMATWTFLETVQADANGLVDYIDPTAAQSPRRFYRLVLP